MAEPWERQQGETSQQFEAFRVYRDLGPRRSLDAVVKDAGVASRRSIGDWSRALSWVSRCEAWDDHVDAERRKHLIERQKEALDVHDRIATAMLNRVAQRLTGSTDVKKLDPSKLTANEVARLADVAVRMQRLALGIPDPRPENQTETPTVTVETQHKTLEEVLPGDEREWARILHLALPEGESA